MHNKLLITSGIIGIISLLLCIGCAQSTPAPAPTSAPAPAPTTIINPVKVSALTYEPSNANTMFYFHEFRKIVEQRSNGALVIDYKGGPEVIPSADQLKALSNGVVDLIQSSQGYFFGSVPEIWLTYPTSPWVPQEEFRKNGIDGLINSELSKKMGVRYIAQMQQGPFVVFTKNPLSKADFSGLRLRASAYYEPIIKALGGQPIVMGSSEIVSSFNQGLLDGYFSSHPIDKSFMGLAKYALTTQLHRNGSGMFVNEKAWNGLSDKNRQLLTGILMEMEANQLKYFQSQVVIGNQELEKAGTKLVELPAAEAQKLISLADKAIIDLIMSKSAQPKATLDGYVQQLSALMTKYPY